MHTGRNIERPSMEGFSSREKQYDYSNIPGKLQNELEFKVEGFRRRIMEMMNSAEGGTKNRLYSNIHSYKNFNFRIMILPKVKLTSGGSLEGHISAYLEAIPSQNWPLNWVWLNTRYSVTLINQKDYRKSHFMSDIFSFKGENDPKKKLSLEERNYDYSSAGPEADRGWSDFFSLKTLLDPKTGFIDSETETVIFRAGVFPVLCDPVSCGKSSFDHLGTDRSLTGYVGIRNLGATCYMNSLLQSLYHIGRFRKAVYTIPLNPNRIKSGSSCSNTPISRETRPELTPMSGYIPRMDDFGDVTPQSISSESNGLAVSLLGEASEDAVEWTSNVAKSLFEYESDGIASLESIMSSNACQDYGQNTGVVSGNVSGPGSTIGGNCSASDAGNDQTKISSALQTLFYELQTCSEPVNCRELMRSFGWDASDAFTQHDAQELNRLLCDRLEEEMKNTSVDGSIKALFEGEYENYIECLDVDCTSRRRENFYDIQVDVEGVKSLEESLQRFVEEEILDGENLYEAEGFGKQRAKKGVRFQRFPPVVQFHLKRFQFNIQSMDMVKLNDYFTFPEKLDLSSFVNHNKGETDTGNAVQGNEKYILHTVVIHQGDVHSGHYYAYIRPKPDSDWFRFDDEKVTLVSSSTAIEDNFGGHEYEVWDYLGNPGSDIPKRSKTHSAYILVYVREDQAQDLLSEPIPQEVNPDLVSKYKKEIEMMNLRKRLRQDLNEHVRIQLLLSTSYNISSSCRPKSQGLHQSISSFPWNYIFKCSRDYSLSQLHSELEKRFLNKRTLHADVPSGGGCNKAFGSHLFLLETNPEGNHTASGGGRGMGGLHHHIGYSNGGPTSSTSLSFYTCISSPLGEGISSGNRISDSQRGGGAGGMLGRAIGFGNPTSGTRSGDEILMSDLCRRYHRAGLWDSSCPTLYMCLYLDDVSSLLMDRIPPNLPINADGSYLEKRQRIENKLRNLNDNGGEVLLLLRYFDISNPRINEFSLKYSRNQEIPNLYNLGLIMVSQSTTLKDLNEYVMMEIEKDKDSKQSGGLIGGHEFGLRVCLETASDSENLFPLLDPRCTVQQLQLVNGSSLIFSINLDDSVINRKREELKKSLEEVVIFPNQNLWLQEEKTSQYNRIEDEGKSSESEDPSFRLPMELEMVKCPEFPVLDFHHWYENFQNSLHLSLYLWDPLDGEYRPPHLGGGGGTHLSLPNTNQYGLMEAIQASNHSIIRSFSRYQIREIHQIHVDLRWPAIKAWIYVCNQIKVDPRSIALARNALNPLDASLLTLFSLIQAQRHDESISSVIRSLSSAHYYGKIPRFLAILALNLKGHSFVNLNRKDRHILTVTNTVNCSEIPKGRYILQVESSDTVDSVIRKLIKKENILSHRSFNTNGRNAMQTGNGAKSHTDISKLKLRLFEASNQNDHVGVYRGGEMMTRILSTEGMQNTSTFGGLSVGSFVDCFRIEQDYSQEELDLLKKGDLVNILVIQDSRSGFGGSYGDHYHNDDHHNSLPGGTSYLVTIPASSRLVDLKNKLQERFDLDEKIISKWRFYRLESKSLQAIKDNDLIMNSFGNNGVDSNNHYATNAKNGLDINIYGFEPHTILLAQPVFPILQKSGSRPLKI
ncbi:Ubiquitin carboxyl-terminal hydrolase family protein [Cryptosporidium meleagridis]|uniref:Ubiquitin carboxyl-terminal hydrolase family protein n=1 Tax=Cryptosporidium meleagridis TaxID=93969 RepID=A0A2P4Z4T2_9CRYT|nr:Ubiquitin carboxyl-terminal hydrolase family protein [Cryptosporidium meleagridis]